MWCYLNTFNQEELTRDDLHDAQWTTSDNVESSGSLSPDNGMVTSPSTGSDRVEVCFVSFQVGVDLTKTETKSTKQKSSESFSTTKRTAATKLGE